MYLKYSIIQLKLFVPFALTNVFTKKCFYVKFLGYFFHKKIFTIWRYSFKLGHCYNSVVNLA